jgi:hypothetical protein
METARLTASGSAAARRIPGTRPTVEMVTALADRPRPWCSRQAAAQVAFWLANGSPMPMKTTLVRWSGASARGRSSGSIAQTRATCSTTSPAERLRVNPNCPVAQKVQPMAQPACVEMQTVARPTRPPSQS